MVISKRVNEKDYIIYNPLTTSYDVDTSLTNAPSAGSLNPSSFKKWRVFRKNKDGSIDIVPVSNNFGKIRFKGKIAYANFIYVLNRAAESYINPDYAIKARSFGYNGRSTEMITDYSKLNSTSRPCPTWSNPEKLGCGDQEYRYNSDFLRFENLFKSERIQTGYYNDVDIRNAWVASRDYSESSIKSWMWRAYSIDGSYAFNGTYLLSYTEGEGFKELDFTGRLVPIKRDILISGGNGTNSNPYKLANN